MYSMIISSRLNAQKLEKSINTPKTANFTKKTFDEIPRMLQLANEHGRVTLDNLVVVPDCFELNDYVEIGHKFVGLRRTCEYLMN